jgi:hypothetical protein
MVPRRAGIGRASSRPIFWGNYPGHSRSIERDPDLAVQALWAVFEATFVSLRQSER